MSYTKKIVTDENNNPIEVILNYKDWLEIAQKLGIERTQSKGTDISRFKGVLANKPGDPDPLEFQRAIRNEWK